MQGPDEPRTLTQIRADEFSKAILTSGTSRRSGDSSSVRAGTSAGNGDGASPGEVAGNDDGAGARTDPAPSSMIRAHVLVTVPVLSLMGVTDEPAMLEGFGPSRRPWPGNLSRTELIRSTGPR